MATTLLSPETAKAIQNAIAAAAMGRLADARKIGETALANGADAIALNALLGTFCLHSEDFHQAVQHLRIAHDSQPDDLRIATNLATALAQVGDHRGALNIATEERAEKDQSLRLLRVRGFAAQSLDEFALAAAAYEHVVALLPDDWETWNNLGNVRSTQADHEGAVNALRRAVQLAPDSPPVRLNYANALVTAGQTENAEAEFRSMAAEFSDDWHPLKELYELLRSQNREDEALVAIEEASKREPSSIELLLAVGSQRLTLLDNAGAELAYRAVVDRDPANSNANLGLALVYETANRSDDLAQLVSDAESRGADPDTVNFIRAFDHRRHRRFADGLAAMKGVSGDLETARQAQLLGQLNDGAGRYEAAWREFERMNGFQSLDPSRPLERAESYRQSLKRNHDAANPAWANAWISQGPADDRPSPVFLVGFPRSGTTLLDTMLMGHPRMEVVEEEPTLQRAGMILSDFPKLPTASRELIANARNAYFDDVALHVSMAPEKIIVDKNPLLMGALPLIHRLFPDAKIILAVRHPCDVVLSCFATNFKLNDGMSSFLRLDTAAELYDLSFSHFERACSLLPVSVHMVQYERLVADRQSELNSLFEFLGLDWDANVLEHQKTALGRGRIKTASYSQVAEPIYARSSGRWRNYRKHLEPILPVLQPWIDKFGYES